MLFLMEIHLKQNELFPVEFQYNLYVNFQIALKQQLLCERIMCKTFFLTQYKCSHSRKCTLTPMNAYIYTLPLWGYMSISEKLSNRLA